MKTNPIDFLLSTFCITFLFMLAFLTAWALSMDKAYHVLIDFAVFLLAFGFYTAAFLALLRKVRPYPIGHFSMESPEFTYWKLNAVLVDLAEMALRPFTTVFTQTLIYSAFRMSLGKQTALAGVIRDHPLIHCGDYATIGQNSVITAHTIARGQIMLKPIKIGSNAVVGINCVVLPGVILGENLVLAPGSVASRDTKIPANELWGGIPAKKIKEFTPQT